MYATKSQDRGGFWIFYVEYGDLRSGGATQSLEDLCVPISDLAALGNLVAALRSAVGRANRYLGHALRYRLE